MTFRKFPSIQNHYHEKEIGYWRRGHPEIDIVEYIIQEKIHGANIQLNFGPDGNFSLGKRTSLVPEGHKFYNVWEALSRVGHLVDLMKDKAKQFGKPIRLYGELYGGKVQKGVWYGPEQNLIFYDMTIDEQFLSMKEFYELFEELNISELAVPTLGYAVGLQEAIDLNVEVQSKLTPEDFEEENVCEGGVIKPFIKPIVSRQDAANPFMVKKKNAKFKEVQKQKKPRKPQAELSDEAKRLVVVFSEHITEQRIQNIFSKHGEIEKISQLGEYIRYVLDDAREEFFLEHKAEFQMLSKTEKKVVLNVSRQIIPILRQYL